MSMECLRIFERVISPAPDHISIISLDYVYLVVNDAYLRRHGRRKDEIVGRKVSELLGERLFNEFVKENLDRCFAGETVNYRAWFDFKAGRRFMDVIYYPFMPEGTIEGAVVVSRDMTHFRLAEEKLEESEEKYRHLFENLNDAALLADCASGTLIDANLKAEELLGMKKTEIIGMHQSRLHPQCELEEYREKFAAHVAAGRAADFEGEVIRKDGTVVPVHISASPITSFGGKRIILGLFRDITERRQTESALIESRRFSEGLIDSMQDGFSVFDKERRFVDGNPAFFKMVGYTREELAGCAPPYPYWPEGEAGRIDEAFENLTKGVRKDYEFIFRKKDGTLFPVILSPSVLAGEYGAVKNYFATVKDITARKKMEMDLRKAQKLDSLGKLSGGLAHEFNNLLTIILSNISLAMFYGPGELPLKRLQAAETASLKAKELMMQFLTFARGNTPVKKTLELGSLLSEWPIIVLTGTNVRCEYYIENGLLPVEADEEMLSQAVRNVIANAAESMSGGGIITISARNSEEGKNGRIKGRHVIVTIKDEGTGIAQEDMESIFDPYFTTKSGSSGLGLAVAYSVIDYHGGAIEIESAPGMGTSVSIFLPASQSRLNGVMEHASC